jgi:pimeloyl-ACP methyl ester carboxylesterase
MRPGHLQPAIFFAACVFATGCGLNTAVLQKGGNGRMGVLLNYSCGASVCDPIDPAKPTIVVTHGWNPLPNQIRTTFGPAAAEAIKCRCGDSYNLLSWDWNGVRISPFNDEPLRVGKQQGRMMAAALRARGVDPSQTQIIGHSLGTLVATQAAVCLQDLGPMAQLTLLDPPESYHKQIFYELAPTCHAHVVENYWSPGISGYGAHVPVAGVQNFIVRGTTPVIGIVDLSLSNHVYVMRWYYDTIRCPSVPCGFQNSTLLQHCRRAGSVSARSEPAQLTATSAGSRSR